MTIPGVIKASELAPGEMMVIDLHGTAVAVANVSGAFYAISDTCTHAGCSLSRGLLQGQAVTCAVDGSQFDLADGHVLRGPATARVRTYRVQLRGDELRV